ncbi:hypothetical protein ABT160_01795 [Streptomyces sp. NPDC001941]|uniref:hypothetical protein n=1 Tax=Streptomyces sp. NPDC001941 TaxID=3154659 RepID=UPI00332EBD4D
MRQRVRPALAALALAGAAALGSFAPAQAADRSGAATEGVGIQSVVHVVYYQHANYGGATYTLHGDYGCDTNADVDWQLATFASGWDNVISSWHGYSDCQQRLFENTYYGGSSYGSYTDTSYVGDAMNDRGSSSQSS